MAAATLVNYNQIRGAPISVIEQVGSDACVQFNAAVALSYAQNMRPIIWPAGVYPVTHTCVVPQPTGAELVSGQFKIEASGVTLEPTGLTKGVQILYAGNALQLAIHGLRVSVTDSTLTRGISFEGVSGVACDGCEVLLNTLTPNVALIGIYIGLSDLSDATTASQQVDIIRSRVLSYLGTNIPVGIQVQGYSVNWSIRESAIYNADDPIDIKDVVSLADGLLPANGVIDHNDIEKASVASIVYEASTMAATNFGTVSILNNDFEFAPYVLDMSGLPASPKFLAGPMLCGNTTHPDVADYINNPNAQPVRSDCSDIPNSAITPTATPSPAFLAGAGLSVTNNWPASVEYDIGPTETVTPSPAPTATFTPTPSPVPTAQHAGVGSVSIINCPVLTSNVDAGQTCPTSTATATSTPSPTPTISPTPTQTPVPTATPTRVMVFTQNWGNINVGTVNFFAPVSGFGSISNAETNAKQNVAIAGTFKNLSCYAVNAPGASNTYTFTFDKNGSGTTMTCQISGASATTCSDTSHTVAATALTDLFDIKYAGTQGGGAFPGGTVGCSTEFDF